jgi:Domain of unknown function (DUF4432)
MSECSFRWAGDEFEEALPVVTLWGRRWTRPELLARVGRLEQVAGMRLVEGGDGAERGVRILRCTTGAGFDFEILVDRGFDIGGAWIGGRPLAWLSPVGVVGPRYSEPAGLGWDAGRFDARDRGELIHLAPGETRRYRMEIGGLVGADAIEAFSREARAMVPA